MAGNAGNIARWMGIDITTTEMAVAVSNSDREGFAALPMRGATVWKGDGSCPGFDLSEIPGMLTELLATLGESGWQFSQPGSVSLACRQHDMVLLDSAGDPLLPALSWQCNAATEQVEEMIGNAFLTEAVGTVEPRFILPKLTYVLERDSDLQGRVHRVMTTGDWVLGCLCGDFRLSTSDALSNGLLHQQTRLLANDVLRSIGIEPAWFPEVVQSGSVYGEIQAPDGEAPDVWHDVRLKLGGWTAVAGLGDNHASALGCGMRDDRTLVVSAGTSGTINLACPAMSQLRKVDAPAARFEFYRDQSLLLRMLPFCGDWYNRFVAEFCADAGSHDDLNRLALSADATKIERVPCGRQGEQYPAGWRKIATDLQVASVQYSICLELLLHVAQLSREVPAGRLQQYVLTGGLSQSAFFQQVFAAGIEFLDPGKTIWVSGRTGPLRYKTSASGAMLNARLPEWGQDLANMPEELFPLQACQRPSGDLAAGLQRLLERDLSPK